MLVSTNLLTSRPPARQSGGTAFVPSSNPWINCFVAGEPCGPIDAHDLSATGLGLGWQGPSGPPGAAGNPFPIAWPSAEGRLPAAVPQSLIGTVTSIGISDPFPEVEPGEISPEELAQIDEVVSDEYEAARPVVETSTAEIISFLDARDSILARYGWTIDDLSPEQNPIFVATDEPPLPAAELPPEEPEPVEVLPPLAITDLPSGPDPGEAPWTIEPDAPPSEPEDQSMDLSSLLGGALNAATAYYGYRAGRDAPQRLAQPRGYDGSTWDWLDGPLDTTRGLFDTSASPPPPVGGRVIPRTGQPCRRRRRRRMLTKSDIADISTMSVLLGRNSEAFKTWLAKATR